MNYKKSNLDHTLFIKHSSSWGIRILLIYVNETVIKSTDSEETKPLYERLSNDFNVKALRRLYYFLSINIAYPNQIISLSQHKSILDLLKEIEKSEYRPTNTPMNPSMKLRDVEEDSPINQGHYQYYIWTIQDLILPTMSVLTINLM